jgi:leukotriene-A4 hydrolase
MNFFSSDSSASSALQSLDWDKWFYAPGFPPKPDFDTSLADVCYSLASKWESRLTEQRQKFQPQASDIKGWTANQVVVFLEQLQGLKKSLKPEDIRLMAAEYGFTKSANVEILSRYFDVGLRAKDEQVYQPTAELLGKVGRMKFVRPL